jgi:FAD/FMN-containing dehydrogenase
LGGAQQFGYGPPRRHVIGMKVVLADGSLIKVGGKVVKNVAGYDLCKLFTGSYGTLGVIIELNFKLRPLPFETSTTMVYGNREELLAHANRLINTRIFPVAAELVSPGLASEAGWSNEKNHLLLVRFAGSAKGVAEQIKTAAEVLKKEDVAAHSSQASNDRVIWDTLASLPLRFSRDIVCRVGLRPGDVGLFLTELDRSEPDYGRSKLLWQAGVGDGRIRFIDRLPQPENGGVAILDDERVKRFETLETIARSLGGTVVIEHAPPEIKSRINAWGITGPAAALMQRIKTQLDPTDILSPGRFHFGLRREIA